MTMKYKVLDAADVRDLLVCEGCLAVVNYWDQYKHAEWHEKIDNHGHSYAAAYGPGGQWDVTGGPRPSNGIADDS